VNRQGWSGGRRIGILEATSLGTKLEPKGGRRHSGFRLISLYLHQS
jgi:hypothetical protein